MILDQGMSTVVFAAFTTFHAAYGIVVLGSISSTSNWHMHRQQFATELVAMYTAVTSGRQQLVCQSEHGTVVCCLQSHQCPLWRRSSAHLGHNTRGTKPATAGSWICSGLQSVLHRCRVHSVPYRLQGNDCSTLPDRTLCCSAALDAVHICAPSSQPSAQLLCSGLVHKHSSYNGAWIGMGRPAVLWLDWRQCKPSGAGLTK